MEDNFESLKSAWKTSKSSAVTKINAEQMLEKVTKNKEFSRNQHFYTILILSFVFLGLSLFFYFLAPLQTLLSHIGIGFMLGILVVRVIIELYSRKQANKISYAENAHKTATQAKTFYSWRRKIHGPVTISLITLYSIGFYMLTPEFLVHLGLKPVIYFDVSYIFIAVILIYIIRKNILIEMKLLKEISTINEEFKDL